jgi:hypothetical protein
MGVCASKKKMTNTDETVAKDDKTVVINIDKQSSSSDESLVIRLPDSEY